MSSLQIRTDNLQRVVDSVCYALEDETSGYGTTGTYRHHCTDVRFEPRGCTWMATVVPTMVEGDDREEERNTLAAAQAAGTATFRVRVKCQAIDMDDEATAGIDGGERGDSLAYAIDMDLPPPRRDRRGLRWRGRVGTHGRLRRKAPRQPDGAGRQLPRQGSPGPHEEGLRRGHPRREEGYRTV